MKYKALLVDLDGVVWLGGEPIQENIDGLVKLQHMTHLFFVTNNSTRSRKVYREMLNRLGIKVEVNNIINSGYAASRWLKDHYGGLHVYTIGGPGLVEELSIQGHTILTQVEAHMAEAVVVGLDHDLNYAKLKAALKALSRGALFVATNMDHAIPTKDGIAPGAGSIVALLEKAIGRKVDFNAGKPNTLMLELAIETLGGVDRRAIGVIGDRIDTDMEMARKAGVDGILVLTGMGSTYASYPGWVKVVRNVGELVDSIM